MENETTKTEQTVHLNTEDRLLKQVSRRELGSLGIRLGAGAALAALPVGFFTLKKSSHAQEGLPVEVAESLNFALTLEYLTQEYFQTGLQGGLIPGNQRPIFEIISQHDNGHVELLTSVLGAQAVGRPAFDFTAGGQYDPFGNYLIFLELAQVFKDTSVRAYKGQAPAFFEFDDLLTTALQIHSTEARHAAQIKLIRGQRAWITFDDTDLPGEFDDVYAGEANVAHVGIQVIGDRAGTEAFDEPLSENDVFDILRPFLVA